MAKGLRPGGGGPPQRGAGAGFVGVGHARVAESAPEAGYDVWSEAAGIMNEAAGPDMAIASSTRTGRMLAGELT